MLDESPGAATKRWAGLLLAVGCGILGAGASDWPTFLGPGQDSRSPEVGILTRWPATGPRLVWWRSVGEGYSMPSVGGGRLFQFDRFGDRARLTAHDPTTGDELWRREYPTSYEDYYGYSTGPKASPVVDGNRVFTFGVEGRLRCHRAADGDVLWEVDTQERFGVVQNFFGVGSTPVVEGDLLIVPVGGSPPGSPKIHSGKVRGAGSGVVAFDKRSGKVRYRVSDELASYSSPVVTTIAERRWAFFFARGGLLAFEPQSGEVDFFYPWRSRKLESVNASTPVVVDDTVLISESYGKGAVLLRVKPGGYDVLWSDASKRDKSLETHWNTPVYHDGYVYASSGQSSGEAELRAIDHLTGKVLWSKSGLKRSTMIFVDGYFVVLGEYGTLRLIRANPQRYEEIAAVDLAKLTVAEPGGRQRQLLRYPAWNAPILADGLLYVRGKDSLAALELIPKSPPPGAAPRGPASPPAGSSQKGL